MSNSEFEPNKGPVDPSKRESIKKILAGAVGGAAALALGRLTMPEIAEAAGLPFANGKYQTFPRIVLHGGLLLPGMRMMQEIDLGTLGPDVDTIFGIDFPGDIPTGALVIHKPDGDVLETRVVGIKRTDLETVQLQPAFGGDRFDVYQMSKYGGDVALDAMARLHAKNTARKHQKVVYLGDLGAFETQWGANEGEFLKRIIRAQRPGRAGISEPDFVNPRTY